MSFLEEALVSCLRDKLGSDWSDNLFHVSMDHSPSEQLDKAFWYTSVLVMARGGEDFSFANRISKKAKAQTGELVKWNKARPAYKERFKDEFFKGLFESDVYIFVYSRTRDWIIKSSTSYLEQLRVGSAYSRFEKNGKPWVRIGPYREDGGEEKFIEMHEHRAVMVFDLACYVSRVYQSMWRARPEDIGNYLRWTLYPDKFPGGSAMGDLFHLLLSINNSMFGGIRYVEYIESDSSPADLLVDNLAGFFNETVTSGVDFPPNTEGSGLVFWEVLGAE